MSSNSKEREIVTMANANACSEDLNDEKNYMMMKSYIPRLCQGVSRARELISCKEHRVPWDSLMRE